MLLLAAGGVLVAALAIWLRLEQRHDGLLYPDGYQYLLMARGIGEHLRPTTVLGPGGDAFVPSFDAATKPFFAAVVAAVAELGIALRSAGGLVAAVSSGLASLAGALLVLRLTRSAAAAATCAVALLASPTLGFWWGFAGPDGLAAGLALLAAWLATRRAGAAAGVAAGLAIATRPELVVVVVACTVAALAAPHMRRSAMRAGASSAATVALVYIILRPPLQWSSEIVLAPLGGVIGAGVLILAWRLGASRAGAIAGLALVAGGLAVLAIAGRSMAVVDVGLAEWPLVLAASLAAAVLWRAGTVDARRALLVLLAIAGMLVAAYAYKNPGSERYVANVLVLAGVLVALGVAAASAGRRWLLAAAIVALVGLDAVLADTPPAPGLDPFDDVAPQLATLPPGALVSATPDAYGILLPDRASRRLHAGARGFVVLDAGQRTYAPGFTARGRVVFRTYPYFGFVRPDGTLDRGPTTVVAGVAARLPGERGR